MQVPVHFTTSNAPLAHALSAVGFKLLAVWNDYTDGTLNHLRMPDVKTAKANRRPGAITYVFERREDLAAALKAWDDTGAALKAAKPEGANVTALNLPTEKTEDAMAIARTVMFSHDHFHSLWLKVPARYVQRGAGEVTRTEDTEGNATETHPGVKIVSEGLSKEDREKILQ